jgi:hypothetical protein
LPAQQIAHFQQPQRIVRIGEAHRGDRGARGGEQDDAQHEPDKDGADHGRPAEAGYAAGRRPATDRARGR